ncbi:MULTISPECIES: MFS transporter [unclassified Caballeronia]|uniref:MFS transporter n=1 Tax=unclassified Caballeronia TaxID=2646786 RepID=UPI002866BF26|nr:MULTISPECIES: MFS transporter [unclassified Caballeronia]MDR5740451.1 MFS transporter [Caballeronia sp. LZ016]MDR5809028.1 MFS transporter [Caballeronia sp. LZ019]
MDAASRGTEGGRGERAASAVDAAIACNVPIAPRVQKIVVAIHGIGNQLHSDTVRSVASQFGSRYDPPLPVMPLGYFDIAGVGEVDVRQLDLPEGGPYTAEQRAFYSTLGFAEVYWADIPREVVKQDDTLEESKAWGLSIVSRAQAAYMLNVSERKLEPADFSLAAGVVEEIVETVAVMQSLLAVTEKAGIFKFDLAPVLRDYVGDVQLVADFKQHRDTIVFRFHRVMKRLVDLVTTRCNCAPEVYLIAHSEGTVISFLGILHALSQSCVQDPRDKKQVISTDWVKCLRGFMTIGSPIDKHVLLWPDLWRNMALTTRETDGAIELPDRTGGVLRLGSRIKWRNYYDFGDPVGFALDTTRAYLDAAGCKAFEFEDRHDYGFARYWLPGKAHTEYWTDAGVFNHFIEDVMLGESDAVPPRNRRARGFVSTAIPYLLSFALHLAAVFFVYKAVTASSDADSSGSEAAFIHLTRSVFALACLLMGTTVAARIPRLVKARGATRTDAWLRWRVAALVAFGVGALLFWLVLRPDVAEFLAGPFGDIVHDRMQDSIVGKLVFVAAGICVALSGWFAPRRPRWGRRVIVGMGALMTVLIVGVRLWGDLEDTALWPVVLGGLLFLYAWWLAILIFDLAFVWHRYVRNSVALDTLRAWRLQGRDAQPRPIVRMNRQRKAR